MDRYRSAPSDGGEEVRCGWLRDGNGFPWQVVPTVLAALIADPERVGRTLTAMLGMTRLDIAGLLATADGVDA